MLGIEAKVDARIAADTHHAAKPTTEPGTLPPPACGERKQPPVVVPQT